MARSAAQCASDRAAHYDREIRELLAEGSSRKALRRAYDFLLGEAAKRREDNPGEGALTDAALAAVLWHVATTVPEHRPHRPRGGPGAVPGAGDLLAAYEESLRQGEEDSG